MAEDDIYGSKGKYERFRQSYREILSPASKSMLQHKCRNPFNLGYFPKLFAVFEAKDVSYIRRYRTLHTMRVIIASTDKELGACSREDIDSIMAAMHRTYKSPHSKATFVKDLKHIWRMLFPETDEKGRIDDTAVPYAVRHLSPKVDKSREKLRRDRLTVEEFEKLVNYFAVDPRIQAYLTLSVESLGRPQEILYVRIRDVELHDEYAKILISEHGKEGVGVLQCIDSYPYLVKWLRVHPMKGDKSAFLFLNTGNTGTLRQLKPPNINKMIRKACKDLGIDKPVTCYSLKRNGVTIRRLRGESDLEIQHAARWTSTRQLKTYDLSREDDSFRLALERRGIIKPQGNAAVNVSKVCEFCEIKVGFSEVICPRCLRPMNRREALSKNDDEVKSLRLQVANLGNVFSKMKQEIIKELSAEVGRKLRSGNPQEVQGS